MDNLWQILMAVLGIVMTLVTGIVAVLWHKADGAATKDDLREVSRVQHENLMRAVDSFKSENKEFRETMKVLFANAESDRMQNGERFSKVQTMIHELHISMLRESSRLSGTESRKQASET